MIPEALPPGRFFRCLVLLVLLLSSGPLRGQGGLVPVDPPIIPIEPPIIPIDPPIIPPEQPFDIEIPVPFGSVWRLWRGTAEPATNAPAWTDPRFDHTAWSGATGPVVSGNLFLGGTLLRDMRGAYTTVYLRREFLLEDPASVNAAIVHVRASDGCAVWINGVEVGRSNLAPGPLPRTSKALVDGSSLFSFSDFPVESLDAVLRPGTNHIAVLGASSALTDAAFVLDASVQVVRDRTPPVVDRTVPEGGSVVRAFNRFEILLSEAVQGVDAADLRINGNAATNVLVVAPDDYVFEFASPPPGPVEVTFRPDHGITDTSRLRNPLASVTWSLQVDPTAPPEGFVISEFMADNTRTLRDDDGDRTDWLEIQNTGAQAASLDGWGLSVDPQQPLAWRFPPVVVPKGGFLVVYASGKDRARTGQPLHTNFKLPKSGGYLALSSPSGQTVSAFDAYSAQTADVSYGRLAGNARSVGFFPLPTPGLRNATSGAGFAPEVEFSERGQAFRGTLTLSLATADPAAVIRYTTDHQEPDASSALYLGPLALTNAVEVRARAFLPGLLPGPVHSETYLPLADDVVEFSSDLPVMVIHDFNAGRPGLGVATPAHVQLFAAGTNLLRNPPLVTSRASIAARGSSTAGESKVSLKLELQDELGNDRDESLLGMPKDSDWVLYAPNGFEPILIHNPFAHQLSRDVGRYSPRTRFVVVYLVTKGTGPVQAVHYNGIYVLEEQIKAGPDRVAIDKLSAEVTRPESITGGYLMKIDRSGPSDGYIGTPHQTVLVVDPKGYELNVPQYDYLNGYFQAFDQALYGTGFRDPVKGYRAFVDVPSWIDHHLLNVLTFNVDALRLSAYFHKPRGGKLQFGPLWDFDRALRSTDGRDYSPRMWRSTVGDQGTDFFNYTWWDRLFKDPDFFQEYIDRYEALRTHQFSLPHLFALVDRLTDEVRAEQPREYKKWRVPPRGGYAAEIRDLKLWLSNRVDFIDTQFVRPPAWGAAMGLGGLDFAARTNAVLYFTTDGTDPRLPGGALNPAAQLFTGPLTFPTNTVVTARAYNPDHRPKTGVNNPPLKSLWSAPIRQALVVRPPTVVVSEIHFHPADPGPGVDPQDLEFVELLNRGDAPVDLRGVSVDGGIQHAFDDATSRWMGPGERWLLVHNPAVFAQFHPGITNAVGTYTNSLGNGGDRLVVRGRLGETWMDFRYDGAWESAADGGGRSLVLDYEGTPLTSLGEASAWRASAFRGGSPGSIDAGSVPDMALRMSRDKAGVALRFVGGRARSYRLWTRNDLGGEPWRLEQSLPAVDQDGVRTIPITPTDVPQVYRLTSP